MSFGPGDVVYIKDWGTLLTVVEGHAELAGHYEVRSLTGNIAGVEPGLHLTTVPAADLPEGTVVGTRFSQLIKGPDGWIKRSRVKGWVHGSPHPAEEPFPAGDEGVDELLTSHEGSIDRINGQRPI